MVEGIVTATDRQNISKAMDMQFYWIKGRVEKKYFFIYWKPGSQNMRDCFTKDHPPHHNREICATYLNMSNALIKIDHKVVQEWSNAVLTPSHTSVLTANHTVVQGCDNVIRTYEKNHNCNVDRMTGATCVSQYYYL